MTTFRVVSGSNKLEWKDGGGEVGGKGANLRMGNLFPNRKYMNGTRWLHKMGSFWKWPKNTEKCSHSDRE